jgi:Cu/Zn superoxide dismutase
LIIQVSEREKVPRVRTTAIAALAVSALLATCGAAYARDLHLKKVAREASKAPSMSWGHFSGELTDYKTTTPNLFKGASATAMMFGINGESTFRLHVRGINDSAVNNEYPAHLHEGTCEADDATAAGGHYNVSGINPATGAFNKVNNETEVWLTFKVNSQGSARVTVSVPFVPTPGPDGAARSIVLHNNDTAKTRLACLPLDIKTLTSSG